MSFDVTTLALAKSYTDQHGGSGGGASTADGISYTNEYLVGTTNVKGALGGNYQEFQIEADKQEGS